MIRVGIAGIGFMGMTHYLAYQKIRGVKVTALCEQDPKRLAGDWRSIKGNFGPQGQMMDLSGIRRYAELDEMVADPDLDLIDICLPPAAHPGATIAALRGGKHVFCEKPISLNPADATRMVQTAAKAERLLMIGHVLPFFPEYQFAYQAITSGKYGQLLGGHFKRVISDPLWLPDFYNPAKVGGPMLDLHVHDAHFIRVVFGMPKAVQSIGTMRGEVVERFTTQFLYDPPRMVTATSGVIAQQGRPFTHAYEIYLEKATLLFDYMALPKLGDAVTPLTVLTSDGKAMRPKLPGGDPTVAFVAELGEVVRSVRNNKPSPLLAGELARDAVVLCQKQTESVRKSRAVKV
ncbi:MAG: Gfo/Idh/MocA family oxidoreductase [Planctomycetaceae bacterium]|nr:Gfo/Idh/MocA family oxidoreductase [Planctomycetaceae bacterium]